MKGRRPTAPGNERAVSTPVVAIAGLGLSALMAGAVLAAAGGADRTPGRVALHVLVVAAPAATGLYALRSPRSARPRPPRRRPLRPAAHRVRADLVAGGGGGGRRQPAVQRRARRGVDHLPDPR